MTVNVNSFISVNDDVMPGQSFLQGLGFWHIRHMLFMPKNNFYEAHFKCNDPI